jgi:protein-disulfide isomerase
MRKKPELILEENEFNNLRRWTILMIVSVLLAPSIAVPQRAQPPNCVGGTLSAPIRLEIFSDFQCSACRTFYLEVIPEVVKKYGRSGKVCVLYNEFPLNGHPYSRKASRYSLAAQRIDRKLWLTVMDALYQRQPLWMSDGNIDRALAGVVSARDLIRIKNLAAQPSIDSAVGREIAYAEKNRVHATPTIFLTARNKTQRVEGALPYEVWKDIFDDILE